MTSLSRTVLFVTAICALALLVFPVFAQVRPIIYPKCGLPGMDCYGNETFGNHVLPWVKLAVNTVIILISTLTTIYLVVAAVQYITSQGDPERSERAKRQVLYALIGLVLALIAYSITDAVISLNPAYLTASINPLLNMVLGLVGLIAAIYIVYAGFKYITSQGDEEAARTAKNQITFAVIGIFLAGTARLIAITVQSQNTTTLILRVRGLINAILTLLALAAVAYVILGGVMYIISQGDQEKASRAKIQVVYALLGIAIIALSALLVNFIIAHA